MDRDMVNCLHYLYQGQPVTKADVTHGARKPPLFWCGPDTMDPLTDGQVVKEGKPGASWALGPGMMTFLKMVELQLDALPPSSYAFGYPFSRQIRQAGEARPAFLAIPYAKKFEPVKKAVLAAAERAGFVCDVTGDLKSPTKNLVDDVWKGIRKADVIVADITGNNPNVIYEIGLAHALGKEVILISQSDDAPFDIRHARRESYATSDLKALTAKLVKAFQAVSSRYPHEDTAP